MPKFRMLRTGRILFVWFMFIFVLTAQSLRLRREKLPEETRSILPVYSVELSGR